MVLTAIASSLPRIPGYILTERLYDGKYTAVYRATRYADTTVNSLSPVACQPVIIKVLQQEYPSFSDLVQLRNQYLRTAAFWRELVASADLEERERHRAKFFLEQMLDAAAPSNFFLTNPEAIEKALETKGESLKHGLENLKHDIDQGHIAMTDETVFKVGENLATTPGQVVFRNDLIELLHKNKSIIK